MNMNMNMSSVMMDGSVYNSVEAAHTDGSVDAAHTDGSVVEGGVSLFAVQTCLLTFPCSAVRINLMFNMNILSGCSCHHLPVGGTPQFEKHHSTSCCYFEDLSLEKSGKSRNLKIKRKRKMQINPLCSSL